jgi:hypothetical protein
MATITDLVVLLWLVVPATFGLFLVYLDVVESTAELRNDWGILGAICIHAMVLIVFVFFAGMAGFVGSLLLDVMRVSQ